MADLPAFQKAAGVFQDIAAVTVPATAGLAGMRDAINATRAGDLTGALTGATGALEALGPLASTFGIDLSGWAGPLADITAKSGELEQSLGGLKTNAEGVVGQMQQFAGDGKVASGLGQMAKALPIIATAWAAMGAVDPKWGDAMNKFLQEPSPGSALALAQRNPELPLDVLEEAGGGGGDGDQRAGHQGRRHPHAVGRPETGRPGHHQRRRCGPRNGADTGGQGHHRQRPHRRGAESAESIGFTVEHLPTGEVKVTANTDQAKQALDNWRKMEADNPVKPPVKPDTAGADRQMQTFFR